MNQWDDHAGYPTDEGIAEEKLDQAATPVKSTGCLPGVSWQITDEKTQKQKYVDKLGEAEYNRRLVVAKWLADGLKNWRERMVLGVQFESVAMQLDEKQFAAFEKFTPNRAARLIYKLAGVG